MRYKVGRNLPKNSVYLDGKWRSKDPITYYLWCFEDDRPTWDMTDLFGTFTTEEEAQRKADELNVQEEKHEKEIQNKVVLFVPEKDQGDE